MGARLFAPNLLVPSCCGSAHSNTPCPSSKYTVNGAPPLSHSDWSLPEPKTKFRPRLNFGWTWNERPWGAPATVLPVPVQSRSSLIQLRRRDSTIIRHFWKLHDCVCWVGLKTSRLNWDANSENFRANSTIIRHVRTPRLNWDSEYPFGIFKFHMWRCQSFKWPTDVIVGPAHAKM